MGIIERINTFWKRTRIEQATTNMVEIPASPYNINWNVSYDRRSLIIDSRAMVADDPRAKTILKTLARDIMKGGFNISITGPRAEEALDILNSLIERLQLTSLLTKYLRLTFKDGDSFLEVGVDETGLIQELSRKPTLEMYRNSDVHDTFPDPTKAYYWTDSPYITDQPGANVIWFEEWRIIHIRFEASDESKYGEPLLSSARKPYKRMTEGERDLSIRRKTRSTIKYLHVLEGATTADIEAYKVANEPALADPFAAIADYFTNKSGSVQVLQGDANLSQIEDIKHHVDTFGVASPVPLELIGYGENLNRDVLEEKKDQYDEALESLQGWVKTDFLMPLFIRQLLFVGIWPAALNIDLQWKQKSRTTPAELQQVGGFASSMQASGLLSDETLIRMLATYLPEFDVEKEIERVNAEGELGAENLMADVADIPDEGEEEEVPPEEEELAGESTNGKVNHYEYRPTATSSGISINYRGHG